MAKFAYTAADKEGHEIEGTIESTSESRARKELASQGFTVTKMSEVVVTEKKASAKAKICCSLRATMPRRAC